MPSPPESECTGIAASWCPMHGDCTCLRDDDGEIVWRYVPGIVRVHGIPMFSRTARSVVFHDLACPLHGPTSAHGDD